MQHSQSAKVCWQKITILFTNHQTAYLDEIAAAIRRETGSAISRSSLVRAMAMAAAESHREFLDCSSEREIRDKLVRRLGGART